MDKRKKTKTFGLKTPTDLHYKLLFDIERLRLARSSLEARYAAFDCAVDAWHLVDWTLHHEAVNDTAFERLTGRKRNETKEEKEKHGKSFEASFAQLQKDQLPNLKFCRMLANSVKHREVRRDSMPKFWSGSTARFSWSEPTVDSGERSITGVSLVTYVEFKEEKCDAVEFFEEMADQWQAFLAGEGIFHPIPDFSEED